MADANEDTLGQPLTGAPPTDDASSDEDSPQDFRFLAHITNARSQSRSGSTSAIPRRGLKDFEPDPTQLQSSTLAASRQAMHDALSYTRVHAPKGHVLGVYDARTGITRVRRPRGVNFKSLGVSVTGVKAGSAVDLWPEEALWMLERGTLDVRWGGEDGRLDVGGKGEEDSGVADDGADGDVEDGGSMDENEEEDMKYLPMSLQGAYAAFIGGEAERGGGLTQEKYTVYAGLKRAGFIVLRGRGFHSRPDRTGDGSVCQSQLANVKEHSSLFEWLRGALYPGTQQQRLPLVTPGVYRSYGIFAYNH